jgi:hypothetical protein
VVHQLGRQGTVLSDTPRDEASDPNPRPDRSQGAKVGGTPRPAHDEHDPLFVGVGAICHTATRLTGVDGAAVAVLAITRGARELAYATDALAGPQAFSAVVVLRDDRHHAGRIVRAHNGDPASIAALLTAPGALPPPPQIDG